MSEVREMADPHLAAIRMLTQSLRSGGSGKLGSQLEGARFNLFTALDAEDYTKAMDWVNALEAGLSCLEREEHPAAGPIKRAVSSLREIIEDETEEDGPGTLARLVTCLSACIAATPPGGSVERAELLGIVEACGLELEDVGA